MSNPVNTTAHERLPPRLAAGALTLLLAACVTAEHPSKAHDAAAYNVQLGIAYLHQGDVALAKDKLDRALAEDPGSADVHSAQIGRASCREKSVDLGGDSIMKKTKEQGQV